LEPSDAGQGSTFTPQHSLAPWEISVFEPADFFQYGVGAGLAGLGSLGGTHTLSATDDWLAGSGHDSTFALDVTGINWPAGTRSAPETTFGFSDVLQNDVLGEYIPPSAKVPRTAC
jgi:hypothetical protein